MKACKRSMVYRLRAIALCAFVLFFGGTVPASAETVRFDQDLNEKLLTAIQDGDAMRSRTLLAGGADPNAVDSDGITALMIAATYGNPECVELLLSRGANANARSKQGLTPLMLAVGDARKVRLLLAKGAEVNAKSEQGHTALSIAVARAGAREVVRILLDHGANVRVMNLLGAAVQKEDLPLIKLLLEKGADINDRRIIGADPVLPPKRQAELAQAAAQKNPPPQPLRMGPAGAAGATPIMYAAMNGNMEIIALLLERGVDIHARAAGNRTVLMMAAMMGQLQAVRLLLEKGAELNVKDDWGYTPLLYAASSWCNDPALVKALLAHGADLHVTSQDGETALKLARRKGRNEVFRILEKAGAKIAVATNDHQ